MLCYHDHCLRQTPVFESYFSHPIHRIQTYAQNAKPAFYTLLQVQLSVRRLQIPHEWKRCKRLKLELHSQKERKVLQHRA